MKKKVLGIVLAAVLVLSLGLVLAGPVVADGPICADQVVSSAQGDRKDGSDVLAARSITANALGAPDYPVGFFYSLGFRGSITLQFPVPVGGTLTVYEITNGSYPSETADVYVGSDLSFLTYIGTANNLTGMPSQSTHPTTFTLTQCITYVRITDTSDISLFNTRPDADAFDLDAVCAEPCPVIEVPVDIKPTSCPNPINFKSKGVLPVAILGTEDFDVTEIDPATVELMGVSPLRWRIEDVATPYDGEITEGCCKCCTTQGPDGFPDLTLKFSTQEIVAALEALHYDVDKECFILQLTGELTDGTAFIGQDVVKIINKVRNGAF